MKIHALKNTDIIDLIQQRNHPSAKQLLQSKREAVMFQAFWTQTTLVTYLRDKIYLHIITHYVCK